jgi:hypothetical protein
MSHRRSNLDLGLRRKDAQGNTLIVLGSLFRGPACMEAATANLPQGMSALNACVALMGDVLSAPAIAFCDHLAVS